MTLCHQLLPLFRYSQFSLPCFIRGTIWTVSIWVFFGPLLENFAAPLTSLLYKLGILAPFPNSYAKFCKNLSAADLCQTVMEGRFYLNRETQDLLNSGNLLHLVALSGGQISFVISFTNFFTCLTAMLLFRKIIGTQIWFDNIYYLRKAQAIIIAFGFWWLFGRSGTLALAFAKTLNHSTPSFMQSLKKAFVHLGLPCHYATRIVTLVVSVFLQGSVFHDLSFLLSCLGGTVYTCSSRLFKYVSNSRGIIRSCQTTILTSTLMSFILMPFQNSNPLICAFSNCILGPFVQYALIPLSLFIYFFFSKDHIPEIIAEFFNICLDFTLELARGTVPRVMQITASKLSIFSPAAKEYLRLAIGISWILEDILIAFHLKNKNVSLVSR